MFIFPLSILIIMVVLLFLSFFWDKVANTLGPIISLIIIVPIIQVLLIYYVTDAYPINFYLIYDFKYTKNKEDNFKKTIHIIIYLIFYLFNYTLFLLILLLDNRNFIRIYKITNFKNKHFINGKYKVFMVYNGYYVEKKKNFIEKLYWNKKF